MTTEQPARPCGCPGKPGAAHFAGDKLRPPCPMRGRRTSGPPAPYAVRKERGYSDGNPRPRLPPGLAAEVVRWDDVGLAGEAEELLRTTREKKEQTGSFS